MKFFSGKEWEHWVINAYKYSNADHYIKKNDDDLGW